MNDLQRRIDNLIVLGDIARKSDQHEVARQHYQEAALLDEGRLESIPVSAKKTRGVIASNVATLYAQAHEYDHARRFIYRSLSLGSLSTNAEQRLEEVLGFVLDRIALSNADREYTDDALGIALRGGEVGRGSAPADTAVNSMKSWQTLVIRFAEASLDLPYRPRGPASPTLLQAVSPRVTQPMAGSFRFDLRLTKAKQTSLLNARVIDELLDDITLFIRATSIGDADYVERRVPNKNYRETILELTKSVIPTGRSIREAGVTVRRYGRVSDMEDIVLRPELRAELTSLIKATRPLPSHNIRILEGVLRGLELNRQWISIDDDNASHKLRIDSEALEDVIGMMVNHQVRVEAEEINGGVLRVLNIDLLD